MKLGTDGEGPHQTNPTDSWTTLKSRGLPMYAKVLSGDPTSAVIQELSVSQTATPESHELHESHPLYFKIVLVGSPINIKLIQEDTRTIEPSKAGYKGKVQPDAIEKCIDQGNRYFVGSNAISRFFGG